MGCKEEACTFLRGEVFISDFRGCEGTIDSLLSCGESSRPLIKLGNVQSLNVFVESEIRGLSSKTNAYETLSCAQTIINNVRVELTLASLSDYIFDAGLWGSTTVSYDSGSEEESFCHSIDACQFQRLKRAGITSLVAEVIDQTGSLVRTLEEGIDYKLDPNGVEFLRGQSLAANEVIKYSYDFEENGVRVTEALSRPKGPVTLYFKGVNLKGRGFYTVELFKVLLQPTTTLELLSSDNFQTFSFNGVAIKDCSRGEGLSQYLKIKRGKNGRSC